MRLDDETPGTRRLYAEYRQEIWEHTDRMFLWLLAVQWLAGIATAIWVGPHPATVRVPVLVWKAFFLGGGIAAFPMLVILRHPGSALTRQEIAIGQALLTALITHLSGGRSELHALPFIALAFLAMYRDWTVLLLATLVTAVDRVLGCYFWPHSIYGVGSVGHWAWFLDTVLPGDRGAAADAGDRQEPVGPAERRAQAGDDRQQPRRAGARGGRAAAHGAPAVAAVRDHARAGGLGQPGRGGAADPAHHGREPGLALRRAVGGRRRQAGPALRRPVERRRLRPPRRCSKSGGRRC